MPKYAAASRAFGFCDICGFRYDLPQLKALVVKRRKTETLACPTCWTPDQPQLQLGERPFIDPQALRNPRPDTAQGASRAVYVPVYSFSPEGVTAMSSYIGQVT